MGDITLTSLSGTATADSVNENIYDESNSSFRAINGYLNTDNKDSSWTVDADQIRNQSTASGSMVGLTGNLDYAAAAFPSTNTDTGAYLAIPGCCQTFYLPFAPSLLVLTWTVQGTNNQRIPESTSLDPESRNVNELKAYLDGTGLTQQFRAFPATRPTATFTDARNLWRDRIWSGHVIKTDATAGFHTLECRLFNSGYTTRIRIRNMKFIYFR